MNKIFYKLESVAFNQTTCDFCYQNYDENEQVVQLGCRHLLHSDCYEAVKKCVWPQCQVQVILEPKSLDKEINAIFDAVISIEPSFNTATMRLFKDEIQYTLAHNTTDASNMRQQLSKITEELYRDKPSHSVDVIKLHSNQLVQLWNVFLRGRDHSLRPEIFLKHLVDYSDSLSRSNYHEDKNTHRRRYLALLVKEMAKNEEMILLLKQNEENFLQEQIHHLDSKNLRRRIAHVYHMDNYQLQVLGSSDETKNLVRLTHSLHIAKVFIITLGCLSLAIFVYRHGR